MHKIGQTSCLRVSRSRFKVGCYSVGPEVPAISRFHAAPYRGYQHLEITWLALTGWQSRGCLYNRLQYLNSLDKKYKTFLQYVHHNISPGLVIRENRGENFKRIFIKNGKNDQKTQFLIFTKTFRWYFIPSKNWESGQFPNFKSWIFLRFSLFKGFWMILDDLALFRQFIKITT